MSRRLSDNAILENSGVRNKGLTVPHLNKKPVLGQSPSCRKIVIGLIFLIVSLGFSIRVFAGEPTKEELMQKTVELEEEVEGLKEYWDNDSGIDNRWSPSLIYSF